MEIHTDIIQGSSAINELIKRLNKQQLPDMDKQYIDNVIFFIRKYQKAIHIHSYDINAIKEVYDILQQYGKDVMSILETEYDIILPYDNDGNMLRLSKYIISYINFKSMNVNERDIPHVRLLSVTLLTDEEFSKKYTHNRLTQYALGSKYYINALRTEENIFRTHKCIICTGSFQEIERFRNILIQQNIPCGNINMDVLCISPIDNIDYLYRLIYASIYYYNMKELEQK